MIVLATDHLLDWRPATERPGMNGYGLIRREDAPASVYFGLWLDRIWCEPLSTRPYAVQPTHWCAMALELLAEPFNPYRTTRP